VERKEVFVIIKWGEKSYWHVCGVAFVNNDGSLNVKLDLFPNVDLQIRDAKPKEARS
jgi:hypothetical protein